MLLELQHVSKSYGAKQAVKDVSLGIDEGVIYGIIGPNGAGKTTTIRMIMDITAPDSGQILYKGAPTRDNFKDRVGYLPEERGLYKKMTLEEIILYMGELKSCSRSVIKQKMQPWLDRMNLGEYRQQKVEELSKGMQQKLQFITTIIHDPELIVLDELFSGLDPLNIELIKNIILDLKREGKTILFSTHVMEQAEKLCDSICMISSGKKVLDGSLGDIKAQFGHNNVQLEIEGDGNFIAGLDGVAEVTEFNNYIELRLDDSADSNTILKAVVDRVRVTRFDMVEPSLYDIFIETAQVDRSAVDGGEAGDE